MEIIKKLKISNSIPDHIKFHFLDLCASILANFRNLITYHF